MQLGEYYMSSLIALCVSIGVLGGVATYLALGPLEGFILIWGIFIGWATFFALGGDNAALKKGITCNVFGAVCAWLMAIILANTALGGLGAIGAGIAVGATVLGMCLAAHLPALDSIPAIVYGYAATAAYLLENATDGAMEMGPLASADFTNALILVSVSLVVGALFGLGSGKLGGVLTSGE
jgi:hypothetical protein